MLVNIRRYFCPWNTNWNREWESYTVTFISCVHWLWDDVIFQNNPEKNSIGKMELFNNVTEAFLTLSKGLEDIDKETRCLLWWFMNLLYDKTSPQTSINLLRKELFTRGRPIEKIPPTLGELLQHDQRTTYQGGQCWGKMTEKQMLLPSADLWGWCKKNIDENYVPLWTLHPIASKISKQLRKCGCSLWMACSSVTALANATELNSIALNYFI